MWSWACFLHVLLKMLFIELLLPLKPSHQIKIIELIQLSSASVVSVSSFCAVCLTRTPHTTTHRDLMILGYMLRAHKVDRRWVDRTVWDTICYEFCLNQTKHGCVIRLISLASCWEWWHIAPESSWQAWCPHITTHITIFWHNNLKTIDCSAVKIMAYMWKATCSQRWRAWFWLLQQEQSCFHF